MTAIHEIIDLDTYRRLVSSNPEFALREANRLLGQIRAIDEEIAEKRAEIDATHKEYREIGGISEAVAERIATAIERTLDTLYSELDRLLEKSRRWERENRGKMKLVETILSELSQQ